MNTDNIREAMTTLQERIHETARSKGWWEDHTNLQTLVEVHGESFGVGQDLPDVLFRTAKSMLAVTEIAEGVEALRHGDPPDDKCPEFSGQTVEMADDIIRQFDLAGRFGLPLVDAILAKVAYNEGRVVIEFGGDSVGWVGMSPDQARQCAGLVIEHANDIDQSGSH